MSGDLANRLGLTRQTDAVKIERDLLDARPQDRLDALQPFAHLAWTPALRRPRSRLPPDCELRRLCPSADQAGVKRRIPSARPAAHRPP